MSRALVQRFRRGVDQARIDFAVDLASTQKQPFTFPLEQKQLATLRILFTTCYEDVSDEDVMFHEAEHPSEHACVAFLTASNHVDVKVVIRMLEAFFRSKIVQYGMPMGSDGKTKRFFRLK
jgi:hypothetical protein